MSPWERLVEKPQSQGHFVQMYTDESELARSVGQYLYHGLRFGDGVLVIATPDHQKRFKEELIRLGADVPALLRGRRLAFFDAGNTLAQCLASGSPDWRAFEKTVRAAMSHVRAPEGSLRAYGEMVGLLWNAKRSSAAVRLEQLWNHLLEQSAFSLYCAYPIGVFDRDFDAGRIDGVLCAHTHLIPTRLDGALEAALNRSLDEIVGPEADAFRSCSRSAARSAWAVMPAAEATLLSLRENYPREADRIVRRAQDHYRARLASSVAPPRRD